MKDSDLLVQLFWQFALLSLVAIGGANAVLPEIHRQVVETGGWISDKEFSELFAIAQAAPGPNVIIVSLVGWKIAGIAGALISTIGMCGPSSIIAFFAERLTIRFRASPMRILIQKSFAPVTIGLVLASGYVLTSGVEQNFKTVVAIMITVVTVLFTRLNPLWLLVTAAILGMFGII